MREDLNDDQRGGMTGPDHYREAEKLLDEAKSRGDFNPRAQWCLELAKLHTALAQVAATALTSDGREWVEAAGRRFCDMSLALRKQVISVDLKLPCQTARSPTLKLVATQAVQPGRVEDRLGDLLITGADLAQRLRGEPGRR